MSNDDISGTGRPIDFVFDSRVGFLGTADRMDVLPVRPNPRGGRFPPNFPRTRVQVASRDTWFHHIPEKFPLRDRICRKNLFLGYPNCDQATGHGKRTATPTLFPSPGGHPTDVPYLGDFC